MKTRILPALMSALLLVTSGGEAHARDAGAMVAASPAVAADTAGVAPGDSARTAPAFAPGDSARAWHAVGSSGAGLALPDTTVAAAAADSTRPVDWLWVTRVSLESPEAIARTVARAKEMRVRGLLVQVIGRGDAWYRSDRLPRAEALARTAPDFDPLGEMLARAHAAGIEVHAWVNCCLVWSADHRPESALHVAREHPDWFAALPNGRSLLAIGPRGWRRLGIEGAFLSPSDERVRVWVAGNVAELVRRYAVDGIHLDYIRTPRVDAGYDGATRVAFAGESGVDRARVASLPAAERADLARSFSAFQDRQVTAIVRAVRDSIAAIRPGLPLSAAVRPDPAEAARWFGQPWVSWLADSLLDRVFPMCYSPATQTVLDQLTGISRQVSARRVVPGLAVYNASPTSVASHVKGVRALGFPELALYSYDSLFEAPRYWERLALLIARSPIP